MCVCICVCVCLCCTPPANSNSSVASEQEERGSLKTQIQQLHNQQFCSSQNPPCYEHTPPSCPSSSPSHACWQSPPIILSSSHSNSSSQLSSLVPRPTHAASLLRLPLLPAFMCSPGPCHLLLALIKRFLLLLPHHHHPSFTSNFTSTYGRTTNQEY